jgi:hypothetical protein
MPLTPCEVLAIRWGELTFGEEAEFFLSDGVSFIFNHNLLAENGDLLVWEA